MKRVIIYGKNIKEPHLKYLDILLKSLHSHGIEVFFYADFMQFLKKNYGFSGDYELIHSHSQLAQYKIDMLLSFGGDGTILDSTVLVKDSGIPVLGINLGRLGFLAIVEKNSIKEAVDNITGGNYTIEKRSLLQLNSEPVLFEGENFALNDFTIHKSDSPSVIAVHTYLDGRYLSTYWVDGLIISTPTGSTGYSLSCGGPIVFPGSGNIIITPVAPHNLTMRSLVVPDTAVLDFEIESRSGRFLCTLDARYVTIDTSYKLSVRKAPFKINLVVLEGYDFIKNLQNKLNWGNDKRN